MENINYPLLYYTLPNESVLGILVGTEYKVVDKDLKSLKATLSGHLQKKYKREDEYDFFDIIEPKLKIIEMSVRPTYQDERSAFPMKDAVKVPVAVIYGESDDGGYECYLPTYNRKFHYYDAKQFNTLVRHFCTHLLNELAPEELYRHIMRSRPEMDKVTLRVNYDREFDYESDYKPDYRTLTSMADRYPYSKAIRRNISAFPDAAWELEHKVSETIEKLINSRSNILLVGKPSVGKSSVLKQAIKKITSKKREAQLTFTFWQIMPQRITATAKWLGEWQENCETLIEELQSANGILWVVDFIRLLQTGGEGPEDSVASFMSSYLREGKLQMVGEVTPEQLESIKRLLPGFTEQFQLVKIDELPEQKIQTILQKLADFSENNLHIRISKEALGVSYRLLQRYYPYNSFPGKAVNFLGQCVNDAQLNEAAEVDKAAVIQNFIKQTGMPELFLRDDLLLKSNELKSYFSEKIIGQPGAVEQMVGTIKVFKAGLNNPYKPITTMIFAGPTGVGKTASARAMADYFFGKGQTQSPLIRIDMSEFQDPSMIYRFIGTGREVGKLVKDIRERPFSVLLLDEVEKAHPVIFDSLLAALDEGILVDAYGRVTNLRNTIIIMTTNLGASNRQSIGFDKNAQPDYGGAMRGFFRPEFLNRIDAVVTFNALNNDDIRLITHKELEDLKQREGFKKRNISLIFTDALMTHLTEIGFDERYGARPLQRAIEQEVVSPLAHFLNKNNDVEGKELVVDFLDGAVVIGQ